ncbi:hypothetical protein FACS18945_5810 [Bacteroidia bacterium]|nr:hypothetical protein FACS18945_5810 [Bacteroidia bacterium]
MADFVVVSSQYTVGADYELDFAIKRNPYECPEDAQHQWGMSHRWVFYPYKIGVGA